MARFDLSDGQWAINQLSCFVQALRRDETELSQMPTQSIDEHCPSANH